MNTRQKSIISELLAGVDLAYCEEDLRELLLHLRTATTYVEGLLALETRARSEPAPFVSRREPGTHTREVAKSLVSEREMGRTLHSEPCPDAPRRHDPSGEIVEIPDLETARRYVGQHVLLGHLKGPTAAENGGICWAPKPSTLMLAQPLLCTGAYSRTITDGVVLRVLPKPQELVVLIACGAKKISTVKALRNAVRVSDHADQFTGNYPSLLGLKAAKTAVESAPIVLATRTPWTDDLVLSLRAVGAQVDILPADQVPASTARQTKICEHFAALARGDVS